jgi:hypothetical protein
MRKIHFVTRTRLNRALTQVARELKTHGAWTEKLQRVELYLVPVGAAYGWQNYGTGSEICIPAVSLMKMSDMYRGRYVPLSDVVRHEYAHALADTHRGLIRSRRFRDAFGTHHEDDDEFEFDPRVHVSEYAAQNASEDFAETFMYYLRRKGELPRHLNWPAIRAKWRFVRRLLQLMRTDH